MFNPLVSCVCPTTDARVEFLPKMVDCFLSQTYENRELVVAVDHSDELAPVLISGLNHPRLRVVTLPRPTSNAARTLGHKRNFLCEQARGEVIAHFDDDDWSAPPRLSEQIRRLESTRLAMTGYTQMKFTNGQWWKRYVGDRTWPLGTSLCFLRSWWERNRFEEIHLGSDTTLIHVALRQGQVDRVEAGNMMFARVHGANINAHRSYSSPETYEPLPATEAILTAA